MTTLLTRKLNEAKTGTTSIDGQAEINELQDDFHRMTENEICDLYAHLESKQREIFIFIAFRVLSHDGAISILKMTTVRTIVERAVTEDTAALVEMNADAERRAAKSLHAGTEFLGRIKALTAENDNLRRSLDDYQQRSYAKGNTIAQLEATLAHEQKVSDSYRTIFADMQK